MKKRGIKAQSAMEYLLTYGWAILIVIIVLSLLFYLGVFSPESSGTCVITAPFICRDFIVNENSVGALLSGKEVSSVTINSIKVNGKDCVTSEANGGMGGQLYSDTSLSDIEYGGQAWVRCVGIDNNIGEKTSVDIDLGYFSKSGLAHSITGYVSSSGESGKGTFDYTHIIDNNIVLSYDFEDVGTTTQVKDLSEKGNDGTTYDSLGGIGLIECTVSGRFGNACLFDGTDDYIRVPNDNSLDMGTGDLTIEYWFNANLFGGRPVSKGATGATAGYSVYMITSSISNIQYAYDSNPSLIVTDPVSYSVILQNTWHHMVVIFKRGNQMTVYIDNNAYVTTRPSMAMGSITGNSNLLIGKKQENDNQQPFNGYLDSVVIYNRALQDWEIKDRFCYTEHSNPTYQQYCAS